MQIFLLIFLQVTLTDVSLFLGLMSHQSVLSVLTILMNVSIAILSVCGFGNPDTGFFPDPAPSPKLNS